ncbi:MAG: alpha/beta hydrolase [Deltaproteobacteria bacterium]|nr:alpha/beta hydrolase [Deltaproteobacteria bacterium]
MQNTAQHSLPQADYEAVSLKHEENDENNTMDHRSLCGLLLFIIYDAASNSIPTPFDFRKRIWLNTRFGKVETWLLAPPEGQDSKPFPVVIFAHGNGELIDYWPGELKKFTDLGLGVLLVEYPGYGRSEGSPSQKSIAETFEAAYDMLIAREDIDTHRIIFFGRSVGGGAVCDLAAKRPSAALILMSTFTGTRSFAPKYLVPGFLIRDPFDNLTVIRTYTNPVLIMHGKFDEIIPYAHGKTLYETAKNGKMITYLSGHNDCPIVDVPKKIHRNFQP